MSTDKHILLGGHRWSVSEAQEPWSRNRQSQELPDSWPQPPGSDSVGRMPGVRGILDDSVHAWGARCRAPLCEIIWQKTWQRSTYPMWANLCWKANLTGLRIQSHWLSSFEDIVCPSGLLIIYKEKVCGKESKELWGGREKDTSLGPVGCQGIPSPPATATEGVRVGDEESVDGIILKLHFSPILRCQYLLIYRHQQCINVMWTKYRH